MTDSLLLTPRTTLARLGDILVEHGAITPAQLERALAQQGTTRQRLGAVLLDNGWADEEDIARARAVQMDVPYVRLGAETPDPLAIAQVPYSLAQRYGLLPLREDGDRLRVAMANPWDVEAIDMVQHDVRLRVEPLLASEGAVRAAIARAYQTAQGDAHDALMDDSLEQAGQDTLEIREPDDDVDINETLRQSDQGPVIKFVNTIFSDAVRRRASDIHIEPRKQDFLLRYRIDGQLVVARTVPRHFLPSTVSRIKVMAEMDISERRLPLDGRIALRVEGRGIDLRVSTLPTQYGERVVMRILDRSSTRLGLDQLGFSAGNQMAFEQLIQKPHGILLVTGPTGSGKTTTLYAALHALKSPTTNIITCEDPIEYELEGISQSNVNEKAGLTFARQLRAILRQDPDVVLVGEIRDRETAEIAFRAALTGHLVLSTLHCNEAAGAASRLLDMGVAPFLIASTLAGVVAQRLVRRLCPACRRVYTLAPEQRAALQGLSGVPVPEDTFYEPVGCPQCEGQGTMGRLAVHEVLLMDSRQRRLIMEQAETEALRQAALEAGMVPMIGDGLQKAGQGLTTFEDVQRKIGLKPEE